MCYEFFWSRAREFWKGLTEHWCRRRERRRDVLEYLGDTRRVESVADLSELEGKGVFLEGTGSIVFDHVTRVGYACLSPRTDEKTFREVMSASFKAQFRHFPYYKAQIVIWLPPSRVSIYGQFQKKVYKVSVFKVLISRFPLILAGRWNMGDMKVETLEIFFWNWLLVYF